MTRPGWYSQSATARRSTSPCSTWATASAWWFNEVDVVRPDKPLAKLPVASAVWIRAPVSRWPRKPGSWPAAPTITGFSQALTVEHLEDLAGMAGMEFLVIGKETKLAQFKMN